MNPFIQSKTANRHNLAIVGKMVNLITALQNANRSFKHMAVRCADRKAQILVFGIATESFQFYRELSLYAQVLKGEADFNETIFTDYQFDTESGDTETAVNMEKLLEDCGMIEKGLIAEFRKLLNDIVVSGDLRKLLQEQLNGFLYAFAKIKMLRTLHISSDNLVNIW